MLHRFDDELVIVCDVEDAATGAWVRQFPKWLITQRELQANN
jgi:hypothetical protein